MTDIVTLFDRFHDLLREIETINYKLAVTKPSTFNGTLTKAVDFRSEMYDKMMELYDHTRDIIACLEYDVFSQRFQQYDDYQYEYFKLKERYQDLKVDFRKIQLESKMHELDHTEDSKEGEESEINGAESPGNFLDDEKLKDLTEQEQIFEKNKQITDKLENITTIMHGNLIAGESNLQDLGASTSVLTDLANKYGYFADILLKTNGLVKMVNESSNAERRQIYRSLYFFIFVCAYILYKRIFKRPIKLFLWLLYSFFRYTLLGGQKLVGRQEDTAKSILESVTRGLIASMDVSPTTSVPSTVSTESIVISGLRDEL
ncbi:hypothetical protein FOA43_003508 [Brettanomyces nanus]|uniref:Sec20 C-terminal domain-containing protein n=1 Tax=Eeniella nana TaxID=13502 RepID=A0A875S887_EENNA|nr:uncharacterized protein FOA43_003508 [Brettanomyces nanus]QPG76122.1 hypothetical protein FOA43_003508 [Brettanomyces nanus]